MIRIKTWYGIRYAQPPTGQFRWQPPRDIEPTYNNSTAEVLNATQIGPTCPEAYPVWATAFPPLAVSSVSPQSSEDCLLLDVMAPMKPVSNNLPVMVMIHGGGEL